MTEIKLCIECKHCRISSMIGEFCSGQPAREIDYVRGEKICQEVRKGPVCEYWEAKEPPKTNKYWPF